MSFWNNLFIMHARNIGKPNNLLQMCCHSLKTHIVTVYY